MKCLIFALVLGPVLGVSKINLVPKVFYDLNEAKDLFDNFIVQFNKQYEDDEYENRLAIFKENLEKLNEYNKKYDQTVFGINHFTDLKYEEVINSYTGMKGNISYSNAKEYKSSGYAPDRLDYRESGYVTGVKNQLNCNSCYVFSAIGSIEGQYAKAHGTLVSLSEQQGFDCQDGSACSQGGLPTETMDTLAQQGGAMSEADYPYQGVKGQCSTDKSKIVAKVTGGTQLSVSNEDDLKEALAEHGPLAIGLTVCELFHQYQGGLFQYNCQTSNGHAVLLVGYGVSADGIPYWIIKNSWDVVWGEQGYMNLEMGKGLCGIGSYVAVASVE